MACPEYEAYYAVVRRIPRGRVLTYGQVAGLARRGRSARRVGYALFALDDDRVPWWRVVNARGEVSFRPGNADEGRDQRRRLEREGVAFDEKGRIDLARFGSWKGSRSRSGV